MFHKARIKLTAWYLVIIMAISLSFSVAIYTSVNRELTRMDSMRRDRQTRIDIIENLLLQKGFPPPQDTTPQSQESLEDARLRIITILGFINGSILIISGVGGYLLAGLTLAPIQKMVNEQKEFVSNASHELRTPITSLKTEMEVALRDKKMTLKDAQELLKSNLEEVNGMQRLSNYLLDLSRYENPDNKFEIKKINLSALVGEAIKNSKFAADQKKIMIVKHIFEKVVVSGNEDATLQLVSILIDNALKYSNGAKKIEVAVFGSGVLTVKDYGIGISEKDLPHIFDRFYRADISRSKEKINGYGLGLSIARSISERMKAKIKVESKLGKGSIFSVQFLTA